MAAFRGISVIQPARQVSFIVRQPEVRPMRLNSQKRKGEGDSGGCGCVVVVLTIGAILVFAFSQSPEGKQAFKQAAAAVQPPVQVSLTPFLVFNGYYVNVTNTSSSTTLTGVTVKYTGASGNSKTQTIGMLKPGETKTLDPSDVRWTVEKHETISVSADGNFVPKVLETNILINK
jgi:hypothetical protein